MEKLDREEHFILRLPPKEAGKVHEYLKTKPKKVKKHLTIDLDSKTGDGTVQWGKKTLEAKLKNLPTITESYKTNLGGNKSSLYKTGDICQMIDCSTTGSATITHPHGLTPPLRNVRKNRFRKTTFNVDEAIKKDEIAEELYCLLKADSEAESVRFEIIKPTTEEMEKMLFGDLSTDFESS